MLSALLLIAIVGSIITCIILENENVEVDNLSVLSADANATANGYEFVQVLLPLSGLSVVVCLILNQRKN